MQKIFGVGFQKTGTTSLGTALSKLGYSVCGYAPFRPFASKPDFSFEELRALAFSLADENDAFKDTPWPILYREMDERYPGSKFILVERSTDKWIASACKDFQSHPNEIHRHIYGVASPVGNEQIFIERYERHNNEVKSYFRDRPDDLLCMHLDRGEVTWENLCNFLGFDIPDEPWPHANTAKDKKKLMFRQKIKRNLRRIGLID